MQDLLNFQEKRLAGEEFESGPVLIVGGGGQRGPFGGGWVMALENLNLRNAFKTVVGVSTGAPTISYFLAGQAAVGTSIYFEENVRDKKF